MHEAPESRGLAGRLLPRGMVGMSFHRLSIAACLVLLLGPVGLGASDPGEAEFFEKRIRPLLIERCHSCHSRETPNPWAG